MRIRNFLLKQNKDGFVCWLVGFFGLYDSQKPKIKSANYLSSPPIKHFKRP